MKIKLDKFSFEFTVKDLEWFGKLSRVDQIKVLAIFIGGACALNAAAMKWYLTIKEENRKDKILADELKTKVKKLEVERNLKGN